MASTCAFCAIAAGGSAAHKVFDEPDALAFLDIRPLFPGHVLLVPRLHVETLGDLPPGQVEPLFSRARALHLAIEAALGADGTFVAMNNRVSQSVPHLHVHIVPRRFKDGLRGFFWPRQRYTDDAEAARMAGVIGAAYREQAGTPSPGASGGQP